MISSLSTNTQAILLLTAPLIVGRGTSSPDLLTAGEYKRLARFLLDKERKPADLLSRDGELLLGECQPLIDSDRLKRLLGRGFLLSQAIERWQTRAIWVASRADTFYPKRLKSRLKEDAPAVIYGCGEMGILNSGGLAVVGSRNVDDELIAYTESVGRLAAEAERTLVSGGARGVDQAAMRGALDAGGMVIGVLADSLERSAMNRGNRNPLMAGNLALISPYDPSAGFNVGHAMQRNKLIYALSDAALVVNSDYEKGGTWAGAVEQLDKFKFVPIYVRSSGRPTKGLDGLRRKGALGWPNLTSPETLVALLTDLDPNDKIVTKKEEVLSIAEKPSPAYAPQSEPAAVKSESAALSAPKAQGMASELAKELFAKVTELLLRLDGSHTDTEIAAIFDVSKSQAKEWLDRSIREGRIQKRGKPARYSVCPDRHPDLFNSP
jgi:DNA processing protein